MSPHIMQFIQYYAGICEACDNNDNGAIIGAVVGAFCVVIIIMVITNIMVWIYCIRIRHHTGTYISVIICVYSNYGIRIVIINVCTCVHT